VIVDISSFAELDVLREVLVDEIYPLDRIGFIPRMILDCGANVGYFASLARVKFPEAQIVCWEPDASNFSRLISQPPLRGDEVKCFQAAVSDSDGEALLTGAGIGCMLVGSPTEQARPVKTINFSHWIEQYGRVPLLIKMDVEGHEQQTLQALRGKWMSPCAMFLETHAQSGWDQEILQDLAADGFNVEILRTHRLATDTRIFKEYLCTLL
jgi:FkbM family methyltransferase